MNMKVHQTLVWLNLLSFRTKDLAAPTIGIQSGLSRVGYRTPGCVQVLVSGAEDLATTACSTFPYTISCKSLHLPQNVHQQQTGLLRHFVSNTQACPLCPVTELSAAISSKSRGSVLCRPGRYGKDSRAAAGTPQTALLPGQRLQAAVS
jgi:hypothetical protein